MRARVEVQLENCRLYCRRRSPIVSLAYDRSDSSITVAHVSAHGQNTGTTGHSAAATTILLFCCLICLKCLKTCSRTVFLAHTSHDSSWALSAWQLAVDTPTGKLNTAVGGGGDDVDGAFLVEGVGPR